MRRFGAHFRDDADDVFLMDARRHRGGKFLCNKHAVRRRVGNIGFLYPQQDAQNTFLNVPHVGGALVCKVVLRRGEHIDKHIADGFKCAFSALPALDELFDFTGHVRVLYHERMSPEYFGFLLTDRLFHFVRLRLSSGAKAFDCFTQAKKLCLYVVYLSWRVA